MAAGLATPPSIDWTEDDGLYQRVQKWTLRVEDMMLGPLAMAKEPAKTRILMCWLPEKITDIVRAAGKVTENNYSKVTEFLLNWAKPKTTEYNSFKQLLALKQGSMNFEQFVARITQLVNDCNYTADKELTIKNFIVTKANSNTAYRECVKAGPDATLDKILEIYRQDAAVDAHIRRQHSDSSTVHQVNAELNFSREGEEDVHKLHKKRRYTQSSKSPTPEKRYRGNTGRACHWCGNSHKPRECPAYGKECLNCGIKNHFARVCNKRKSPRNSPNRSPNSARSSHFRNQRSSNVKKLEPDFDHTEAIRNLQEEFNQMKMQQQRQVSAHSLRTTPATPQSQNSRTDFLPPFFISRKEMSTPQTSVKMLQTEVIEVCQLSERNPEHIRPAWISKSKDAAIEQIDCEVDTGAGCNVISHTQAKELYNQE